jgi:hypothetical protein
VAKVRAVTALTKKKLQNRAFQAKSVKFLDTSAKKVQLGTDPFCTISTQKQIGIKMQIASKA